MTEEELIDEIKQGKKELYELIIKKYNQRLYRIARSMVKDETEIEDILQETYLKAYINLHQFQNKSLFSTWLIRILINNANASLNKSKKHTSSDEDLSESEDNLSLRPDLQLSNQQLRQILETAIDHLPENLRAVYVMREVEGLSVSETALCLRISQENVKTRLHRAKALLKDELYKKSKQDIDIFRFGDKRCDKVMISVMLQLGKMN